MQVHALQRIVAEHPASSSFTDNRRARNSPAGWRCSHPLPHCCMPERRNRVLARIAEIAPPVFRERILPVLENHVFPILSHVPGPVMKTVAVYVLLQIMIAESTTVQSAWARAKYHTPRPVRSMVGSVASTSMGGAIWRATLAIRSTSTRIFHPLREVHANQEERGAAAGDGLMQIKQVIDGIHNAPANTPTTLDEVMKELEKTPPTGR
jgi:hypothetical protein